MRKLLLAGVALAGAAVYLPSAAQAQAPTFPTTARPSKLEGAAPGSVTVQLGGTLFSAIEFESGTGDSGAGKVSDPNLLNYIRLYPNFDYASPSGVHFGVSAEIRSNGAKEGQNRNTNTLYWHSASGYVTSDKFGKFEVGTPNDAIDQLGVGTGDDYGTGGFYGEYGWPKAPEFIAADSYDGDSPKQKLVYLSPVFFGLQGGVSYQPTSVGLNNSSGLLDVNSTLTGAQSKDRIEIAVQFSHAFGPVALKADVGYAWASPAPYAVGTDKSTSGFKDVNYFNAGAVLTAYNFELEGSVNTGKFSAAGNDSGSWGGPLASGEKSTTAYIIGVGYNNGPYSIGAQYYSVDFDGSDANSAAGLNDGPVGSSATIRGEALGAGYVVGPGVSVYFDAVTNQNKLGSQKVHGTGVGLGTYFSW